MPKRSNAFQRLIVRIEKLAASPTAHVVESSELAEYPNSSLRELDVLIEDQISGHPIRIAIECRDYKRKQDKTWIDSLIGKYRDLQIDKVVAVSSGGFTKGALEKATAVGISALTIRQALDADWDAILVPKPFIKFFGHEAYLKGVRLDFGPDDPPLIPGTDFSGWPIVDSTGGGETTVLATAEILYGANYRTAIDEHIAENKLVDLSAPKDVAFDFHAPFAANDRFLIAPDGIRRRIATFWIRIIGSTRTWDANHQHLVYERKVATVATLAIPDGPTHEITIVQTAGSRPTTLPFSYRHGEAVSKRPAAPGIRRKRNSSGKPPRRTKPR